MTCNLSWGSFGEVLHNSLVLAMIMQHHLDAGLCRLKSPALTMAEPAVYLSRIFKHHDSILLQPRGKRRPRAGWQQERLQKNELLRWFSLCSWSWWSPRIAAENPCNLHELEKLLSSSRGAGCLEILWAKYFERGRDGRDRNEKQP